MSRRRATEKVRKSRLVQREVDEAAEEVARGRFADAVLRVHRLRELAGRHAATVAANPRIRRRLFEGAMLELKALNRLGRQDEAERMAIELGRSFPDHAVSEREHGSEVAGFVARVRAAARPRAVYSLAVDTTPPGASVFLNERYVGTSPVRIPDTVAGRYRVMAQTPTAQSRVHVVAVVDESVEVRIDFGFDTALTEAGFRFADPADRARREPEYAVRLARHLGVAEVIAVGIAGTVERPLWVATAYNVESGGIMRSAGVALAPAPPSAGLLAALGRFLGGGERAEGLIVDAAFAERAAAAATAPRGPEARGPERAPRLRLWSYVGLGVGLAAAGAGAYLVYLDGKPACNRAPGQVECLEVRRTLAGGMTALSVGAALVVAGTSLLIYDVYRARRSRARVGAAAAPGGAALWVAGVF